MSGHRSDKKQTSYRVSVPLESSAEFMVALRRLRTSAASFETGRPKSKKTFYQEISKTSRVRRVAQAQRQALRSLVGPESPQDVVSVEVNQDDLRALQAAGWVDTAETTDWRELDAHAADGDTPEELQLFRPTAITGAQLDPTTPAPEPVGPFPWEASTSWRSTLILAGGVMAGGLGTLGIISAIGQGFSLTHVAGLIGIVLGVVAVERTVSLGESIWRAYLAHRDASMTAGRIAQTDL